jgi:hypothetical protein
VFIDTTAEAAPGSYWFRVVFNGVESNVATLTIEEKPILNSRITWDNGKYVLTTDPTDAGLYFQFGSVAGVFSANGAVQRLPGSNEDEFDAGDVAWSPVEVTNAWTSVPRYNDNSEKMDDAYHNAANVKIGKGDPCRLVGLDLDKIKTTDAASLTAADIDNGLWRTPTYDEWRTFAGYTGASDEDEIITTLDGVPGAMFPSVSEGDRTTFLPVTGFRMGNSSGDASCFIADCIRHLRKTTPIPQCASTLILGIPATPTAERTKIMRLITPWPSAASRKNN